MSEKRKLHFKPRKCLECGREFIPRSGTQRYCDGPHTTYCKICGKEIQYTCSPNVKPNYCSQECINKGHEQTVMKRYGVKNVSELQSVRDKISAKNKSEEVVKKREQTCLERYGATNPSKSDIIKEKLSSIMKSEEFLKKREQTCIQRYGTPSPMQSDAMKEKLRKSNQRKYGVDWVCQSKQWKDKMIETNMQKYGVPYYCMTEECRSQQGLVISHRNQQIRDMFESAGFQVELEHVIENRSYDMLLVGTNILIEVDPSYTHTTVGNHWGKRIDPNYHLEKSKLAWKYGYECIHIFDWDNIDKIISILYEKKIIPMADCIIEEINILDANIFLKNHHIYGSIGDEGVAVCLKYNNEIIQIMVFNRLQDESNHKWELSRMYSNKCIAMDGFTQLFQYFLEHYNPKSVISYRDLAKFDGSIYEELNMKLDCYLLPVKIWSKYANKLEDSLIDHNKYDEESLIKVGWLPVYDCGYAMYTYRNSSYR